MLVSVGFTAKLNVSAQPGSMATLQKIIATYAVSIVPGAAQRDSTYHYFPPAIAVPVHTTVAWFNNDFGQPHTVTSGVPGSPNNLFNSGLMPAPQTPFFSTHMIAVGIYYRNEKGRVRSELVIMELVSP